MLEYVYKLNLPLLEEIVVPGIVETLFQPSDKFIYTTYAPTAIIKPEFLNIKGINWDYTAIHFHKTNGTVGRIHCDHHDPKNTLVAAINWIYDGVGTLDYWEFDELPSSVDGIDSQNAKVTYWEKTTDLPPPKKYIMPKGAYLVNASTPHFPVGWGNRHVISLRSTFLMSKTWSYVVDLFSDLIIK